MESGATGRSQPHSKYFLVHSLPLLLALLIPLTAWPQSADIAGKGKQDEAADNSEDSSRRVEESEEAYRRRMETEDARDQSRVILDRTSTPQKPAEGIAALPYESQKHLRDEMRDVIIEQEEWKPEDANTIYPYSPSAAAEKDPELRQQEEAAWGDLVREYHKREAAALAAGGARSGSSGPGQGQNGGKSGSEGQSGMAGSENSTPAGQGKRALGAKPETEAASSTAAGAGVSQSALEFLRGQSGGQSAGGPGTGNGTGTGAQASAGQSASSPMGSGPAGNGQPQYGADTAAASTSQQAGPQASAGISMPSAGAKKPVTEEDKKVAEASEQPSEATETSESDSDEPPPPPGTIAIAKLEALEQEQQVENKEQAAENSPAASSSQQQDQPPPPPGTIAIPELKKLQGLDEAVPLAVKNP